MFIKTQTMTSTKTYSENIEALLSALKKADAVIIGAGAGLSASAGFQYSGPRFEKYFSDFIEKYHFSDMYTAGFYPFPTPEEYWAYWSRYIYYNRYDQPAGNAYRNLLQLVKKKNYFIITTNVDHQFQQSGFEKGRLFYTQGDYGLWQCQTPCHQKTYSNESHVREMVRQQKNLKIPTDLLPYCPVCGAPMTMNLRCDNRFVQDDGWYCAYGRYTDFLKQYKDTNVLFLELGVGENTPGIIKYPFWQMTAQNAKAVYVCINLDEAFCPNEISSQSICISHDINSVLLDCLKK